MPVAEPIRTTPPPPADPPRTEAVRVENRVVLHAVDWATYTKLLEAMGTRRIRLTYDRGTLEIMTISRPHDWWSRRIGFLICLLGCALNMKVEASGSTTLRREDVDRGLEPDESYHIRHAAQMAGPKDLDLTRDPPPDLALEVEVSRSALDRMSAYAALGIPEVWRCDGDVLRVYHRQADGTYAEADQSQSFPTLPLAPFVEFLHQTEMLSLSELIEPFLQWVKEHVLPRQPDTESPGPGNGAQE